MQNEKSSVRTLCPVPGATSRWPCGNWATIWAALSTGVRRSSPPAIASIGTSGSGPAPSGVPPAGDGQSSQKPAVPVTPAQLPNGPSVPAGSAAIADCSSAGRSAIGVDGVHGKSPSAQVVAA